jgi:hypothetical protein
MWFWLLTLIWLGLGVPKFVLVCRSRWVPGGPNGKVIAYAALRGLVYPGEFLFKAIVAGFKSLKDSKPEDLR